MQNNVTDLSQKLQRSLDSNYNVVDMPAVVEIISALEKTAVTKELLETTRLGKYINELRRRTSNESLAKRAKDLLKKWRGLILPDANGLKRGESPGPRAKKRNNRTPDPTPTKRALNGSRELDFSDNSNCSVKEAKTDIIFINSDSNSSLPDVADTAEPKKRGRKKGSKNHKNLVIAAEESFSNKMAVSRNSKVKTTQELLADLQNRAPKSSAQEIELRAAQLTESLSRIDKKLNPQKQINKNVTPVKPPAPHRTLNEVASWSGTSTPDDVVCIQSDSEVDVVTVEAPPASPLTVEALLAQLPPVDARCLGEAEAACLCEGEAEAECAAQQLLAARYSHALDPAQLTAQRLANVNGNYGVPCENYQRYSISEPPHEFEFREWHETLPVRSYNHELLTILPYVVID